MFSCLILGFVAGLNQDRVAIKSNLQNGSTLYVQEIAKSQDVGICLTFANTVGQETPDTHGIRHLLEHLAARGKGAVVDSLLESKGLVLLAETNRDGVSFTISGRRTNLPEIRKALQAILDYEVEDDTRIQLEVDIISQELALRSWNLQLVSDGWIRQYGEMSLDPFGTTEKLKSITQSIATTCWQKLKDPRSMTLSIVGDVNAEQTTKSFETLLATLKTAGTSERSVRGKQEKSALIGSDEGEGVSSPIASFGTKDSLATIAAAMGIRAWTTNSQVVYVPTGQNSLITVSWSSSTGISGAKAQLRGKEVVVAETGLKLVKKWLATQSSDPTQFAKLSSAVLGSRPSFDPQTVATLADTLNSDEVLTKVHEVLNVGTSQ